MTVNGSAPTVTGVPVEPVTHAASPDQAASHDQAASAEQTASPEQAASADQTASADESSDDPDAETPVLPTRRRQANLAPQLRGDVPWASPGPAPEEQAVERSPEATRALMTSIQRGWQRGRSGTGPPSSPDTPPPVNGDGHGDG
jgi:hypothetical protein